MSELLPHRRPVDDETLARWHELELRSRLAVARRARGMRQEDVARDAGLSLKTYRRLENLEMENPPLRYLVNCALVLEVSLISIVEDGWCRWMRFDESTPSGPARTRGGHWPGLGPPPDLPPE